MRLLNRTKQQIMRNISSEDEGSHLAHQPYASSGEYSPLVDAMIGWLIVYTSRLLSQVRKEEFTVPFASWHCLDSFRALLKIVVCSLPRDL